METVERTSHGSRLPSARTAIALTPLGLVFAASSNSSTTHLVGFVALVAVIAASAWVAPRLPSGRVLAAIGGVAAATAAWLFPQRNDLAAALILAALFTVGVGLAVERPRSLGPYPWAVVVAMLAIRLAISPEALLAAMALAAVAGGAATAAGRFPIRTGERRRGRALAFAFGATLVVATLAFTGYLGAETPDASWFGGGTVHGPTNRPEVALTFDDGPNIGATRKIMAILDQYSVKGTFFEVGRAIDAEPRITRMLYDDGQLLGNHSYAHDQWRWLDPRYPELQRTQAAFKRAIGACPVLYRPPHGDRTPFLAHVVRDHRMHMVLWSASAGDWATHDAQLVARRILQGARPGAILLLHDGLDGIPSANREVLVRALPLILDGLRAKGLSAVRLDRMLGTDDYQPC